MHIQQTKVGSIRSGGPQYYVHALPEGVKAHLATRGAVKLALVTPYGPTDSNFFLVDKDYQFSRKGQIVAGSVGHARIQAGPNGVESIGESIRRWYDLRSDVFWRIEFELREKDGIYFLTPIWCKYTKQGRTYEFGRILQPLSFTEDFQSGLWRDQLERLARRHPSALAWAIDDICRILAPYQGSNASKLTDEKDLLRASGALSMLGVRLGPYRKQGFDCLSQVQFNNYLPYDVPVELKKTSKGFRYQRSRYPALSLHRVVILCVNHTDKQTPNDHVDVVELNALCKQGKHLIIAT